MYNVHCMFPSHQLLIHKYGWRLSMCIGLCVGGGGGEKTYWWQEGRNPHCVSSGFILIESCTCGLSGMWEYGLIAVCMYRTRSYEARTSAVHVCLFKQGVTLLRCPMGSVTIQTVYHKIVMWSTHNSLIHMSRHTWGVVLQFADSAQYMMPRPSRVQELNHVFWHASTASHGKLADGT